MPNCCVCGNPVEKLPLWLEGIGVKFRCGRCPGTAAAAVAQATRYSEEEDVVEEELVGEDLAALEVEAELEEAEEAVEEEVLD